jgi:hypothetical protein
MALATPPVRSQILPRAPLASDSTTGFGSSIFTRCELRIVSRPTPTVVVDNLGGSQYLTVNILINWP